MNEIPFWNYDNPRLGFLSRLYFYLCNAKEFLLSKEDFLGMGAGTVEGYHLLILAKGKTPGKIITLTNSEKTIHLLLMSWKYFLNPLTFKTLLYHELGHTRDERLKKIFQDEVDNPGQELTQIERTLEDEARADSYAVEKLGKLKVIICLYYFYLLTRDPELLQRIKIVKESGKNKKNLKNLQENQNLCRMTKGDSF